MTWHEAFMMIPINIGQFQIKYRSVVVELSVRNLPSLVKSVFWLKCGLSIGWVIITREDEPPHPPSLLQHSVTTQLQLNSTPNHHVELIQLLRCYSQSGFRDLSPIFFPFCINRGVLHSFLHGDFRQEHSAKIYIVILVYAIGIRSDFGGLCMSSWTWFTLSW